MNKKKYLSDNFLIAPPTMTDPRFYKAVVYMISHKDEGAMGIVINQPVKETKLENIINSSYVVVNWMYLDVSSPSNEIKYSSSPSYSPIG